MKRNILLAAIGCLALLALPGRGGSAIVNDTQGSVLREVVSTFHGSIYVAKIDGSEYIVVMADGKAAICPKK